MIGGRFEVHERLGQGSMGSVYRGVDQQTGESVAIKALKTEMIASDPDILRRFAREGELLRELNHPNIVRVHTTIAEDDKHYIVMDYVSGGSLRDLLDEQSELPLYQVLGIALDLADALSRAHHLLIIHRDIKPSNIMLADDGTARLTDFGIAYAGNRTRMTETGTVMGTLAYLSPEALHNEALTPRADIWAFGIVLYEMLTGRRPYLEEQMGGLLQAILNDPVPDITQFRSDLPPQLVDLINIMLQKDPEKRVQRMRQIGAELEAIAHGDETPRLMPSSRFDTPTEADRIATEAILPGRPRQRKWLPVSIAGILILMIAGVLLVATVFSPTPEPSSPPVEIAPVGDDEYMAMIAQVEHIGGEQRDVQRFIVDDLERVFTDEIPFANLVIRAYPAVITSDEQALALAEEFGASVMVWGNYNDERIELAIQVGSLDQFPNIVIARDDLTEFANVRVQIQDELSQSIAAPISRVMLSPHYAAGNSFETNRWLLISSDTQTQGVEIVGSSAAAYMHRAISSYLTDMEFAIEQADKALEQAAGNPLTYAARGVLYYFSGQFDAAQRDYETAKRLVPDDSAILNYQYEGLSLVRGDIDQFIAVSQQAIESRPNDWFHYYFRGVGYYLRGDYALARADVAQAIALEPEVNFPYSFAATLALRDADFESAQMLYEQVLRKFPDPTFGDRIAKAALPMSSGVSFPLDFGATIAAFSHLTLGQYVAVVADTEQALSVNDQLADLHLVQGFAYCNLGDDAAAEAAYTAGIEIDPNYPLLYALRAEVRRNQGKLMGALQDSSAVSRSEQAAAFEPLMQASLSGKINCKNFFEADLSAVD